MSLYIPLLSLLHVYTDCKCANLSAEVFQHIVQFMLVRDILCNMVSSMLSGTNNHDG